MITTRYVADVFDNDNIISPAAPIFSPLTPLRMTRNEADVLDNGSEANSSPVRCMSPSTLDLFQTLSRIQSPILEVVKSSDEVELGERNLAKHFSCLNYEGNNSDFSADTDTDYVVDSYSDSSDDDIGIRSVKINVVATVHNDQGDLAHKNTESNIEIPQNNSNPVHPEALVGFSSSHSDLTITADSSIVRTLPIEAIESNPGANIEMSHDDSNADQNETSMRRPKKGRKRKHPDFTMAQTKARKYNNKSFLTKKKFIEPKVFNDYFCLCRRMCHSLVSKEKRQQEFEKYVTLGSYEAQALYIATTVRETKKNRSYNILGEKKSNKKRPREFVRTYTICGVDVCRDMYINNFQVTTKKVNISLKKNRSGNAIQDQRGRKSGGWNKTKHDEIDFIKKNINKLPQYESHYRRDQSNGCKYLKLGTTIRAIYDLYLEEFDKMINTDPDQPKKPVSFSTLKRIFYGNFNLRCKSLKKDTCNKCDTLTIKIKNCTSEVERKQYEEEKEIHLKKAEDLRRAMNEDMMRAKTDEHFECLTFDMEKTLPLPRIPTSVVFYKRQLWFYNCSVHTGSDNIGHCYVWVEGEAGRGSQEVGSCISKYIQTKLDPKIQHLALWSDCCGGQNRNIKIVLMLKAVLNSHPTLKTITFKYLESGHTFLPNDTDFSKIETMLKYHERIYTVEEYINIIKKCKRKHPSLPYEKK